MIYNHEVCIIRVVVIYCGYCNLYEIRVTRAPYLVGLKESLLRMERHKYD